MSSRPTIGIIGLGKMGRPVGRHLLTNGYGVVGFDPVPEACAIATDLGIDVLSSPAEVAANCEFAMIVVGFDEEVEEVVFGRNGLLAGAENPLTIGIGSTISPSFARSIETRLEGRDIRLIDMPSTRGEYALENGEILLLGAGDKAEFDRWTPMFECFARDIFHLGPFGCGQVAKMVNNSILWACMTANDEGLRLGSALGVAPEQMRAALGISSAQNWSMSTRAEEKPIPWAEKDMKIVLNEADGVRISLPMAGLVSELIKGFKIRNDIYTPVRKLPPAGH